MWAISTDSAEELKKMRTEMGLKFPLLIDPGSATIRRYGVLNEEEGKIPHPATFIIDTGGIVRYKRVDEDYKQRPTTLELMEALPRARR